MFNEIFATFIPSCLICALCDSVSNRNHLSKQGFSEIYSFHILSPLHPVTVSYLRLYIALLSIEVSHPYLLAMSPTVCTPKRVTLSVQEAETMNERRSGVVSLHPDGGSNVTVLG